MKQYEKDKQRLWHANNGNLLEYNRSVCDELLRKWEQKDIILPSIIIRNVLEAEWPDLHDDLFFYIDNRTWTDEDTRKDTAESKYLEQWKKKKSSLPIDSDGMEKPESRDLINQFLHGFEKQLPLMRYSIGDVRHTIEKFVDLSPIITLRTPGKIQDALQQWSLEEINSAVEKKRRAANKKWIYFFLRYLSHQNIIAPLPSLSDKVKSQMRRLVKNISDPKTLLMIAQPLVFLIIFVLLGIFGKWMKPVKLSGWLIHFDHLLCGGLLSSGAITATCFLSLILFGIFSNRYFAFISAIFTVMAAIYVQIDWHSPQHWYIWIGRVLCMLALCLLTQKTIAISKTTKINTGISLVDIWLCYCILFVFIPKSFGWSSAVFTALVLVTAGYNYWRRKFNYEELLFSSIMSSAAISGRWDAVRSRLKVEGATGHVPHMFAAMGALIVFIVFGTNWISHRLVLGAIPLKISLSSVYLLILGIMIHATIRTRLSFNLWQLMLNKKHLTMVKEDSLVEFDAQEMGALLQRYHHQFLWKELAFQLAIFIGAFIFFSDPLPLTTIPAYLVLLPVFFIFAESGFNLGYQLVKIFISRSPVGFQQMDFTVISNAEKPELFWDKFGSVKFIKKMFLYIYQIVIGIKILTKIISSWSDIVKFFHHIF